jgi:N-acetylmuramoyl-L-alanine amidase CwlD
LNLTNHSRARISKGLAVLLAVGTFTAPLTALAQSRHTPVLWFAGARIIFSESRAQNGDLAVSINDPGFQRFLQKLGATSEFQAGQHYAVITSADHRSISFEIGSDRFMIDGQAQNAPFSATAEDSDAYIPFYALARALNVVPMQSDEETILQPQIADVETQVDHGRTVVIFHGAGMLHPQLVSSSPTRSVVRFPGTASTLESERDVASPGITHMSVAVSGPARNPSTTVTFSSERGAHLGFLTSPDPSSAVMALAPTSTALRTDSTPFDPEPQPRPRTQTSLPVAPLPPVPASASIGQEQSPGAAAIQNPALTDVTETSTRDGFVVRLALNGQPNYAWRVLSDGRFYIDLHGVQLSTPVREEQLHDARVSALRLRSNGTPDQPNVRLALTLVQSPNVSVTNDANSIVLRVGGAATAYAPREGSGRVGTADALAALPAQGPGPAPILPTSGVPDWKYGPQSFPAAPAGQRNNRLIVLDPGHGGSDSGAEHNGLTEKVLTLDIARRLRALLIARGWQVKMTRDSDVDVYQANDSAHDELQARCDLANAAGARMFVSIHINSFTSSDLQGTTTYYYHPQDLAFASAVENKLIATLGTQNDGAQHANFYVIRHTTMPAILVETAFLSNPDDAARLRNEGFRQSVASAISDGISAYTGGSQTVPPAANEDVRSSYVPGHEKNHAVSPRLVRSASTEDDLSQ